MNKGGSPVKMLFLGTVLATSLVSWIAAGYEEYVVERDCGSGSVIASLARTGAASAALLRATDRASYSLAMDCRVSALAPEGMRIMVTVREIGFRTYALGGCKDYLEVSGHALCAHRYRKDEELHFQSQRNLVRMLYHVTPDGMDNRTLSGYPGFEVVATAYNDTGGRCSDESESFLCSNSACIWSGLRCDRHNNCGDLSDETGCEGPVTGNSTSVLIILGGLILLLLTIMCTATLLCSKNENVRRFSNRLRSRTVSFVRRFSK